MYVYTKRYVFIMSFIISIIIFILVNFVFINIIENNLLKIFTYSGLFKEQIKIEVQTNDINQDTSDEIIIEIEEIASEQENDWEIYIPQIMLKGSIREGTSQDIMDKYIGHFEETSKFEGNVGLAAHNRGYPINYFSELKKLSTGDEITYKYFGQEKIYIVEKNIIIQDTDWSYLENTEDNVITLITCVENEPSYRRCVRAVELK